MVIVLVIVSVGLFLFIEALVSWLNRKSFEQAEPETAKGFADLCLPRGLFLGSGHAWARLANSGELKLGVDEFLAQALGGCDSVELPEPGSKLTKGAPLATISRLRRRIVVPSPIDGTVVATNSTVSRVPSALNADPYGSGWLASVWPVDHAEAIKSLRVGERAFKWLEREVERFTDFLAMRTAPKLVGATIPDGARPVVGAALVLDDEAWEEFTREFTHEPAN